eukprot:5698407-Karenia_brevis.AAC.1
MPTHGTLVPGVVPGVKESGSAQRFVRRCCRPRVAAVAVLLAADLNTALESIRCSCSTDIKACVVG